MDMEKQMASTAATTKGQARWQRILWLLIPAVVGLLLSGLMQSGSAVLDSYPFGLAAVSAASGAGNALAVTIGVFLGSLRQGGVLPILAVCIFFVRAALTLWLTEEQWRTPASPKGDPAKPCDTAATPSATPGYKLGCKPRRLRHSRTKGWIRKDARTNANVAPNASTGDAQPGVRQLRHDRVAIDSLSAFCTFADQRLFQEQPSLRMAMAALAAFLAGAVGLYAGHWRAIDLWGMLFSALLTPVCTYLLYAAHDRHMRTSSFHDPGILFTLALLCRCLSGSTLPLVGVNVGEALALAAALLTGSSYGVSRGALVGLSCGLFLTPTQVPAYAIAGATTGALSGAGVVFLGRGYSRALGLLAGSVAAVVWCVYSGGLTGMTGTGLAPEILVVSAVLLPFFAYDSLVLPAHLCGVLPDTRRSEQAAIAEVALRGREKKLSTLGENLGSLGEMLRGVSEKLIRPGKGEMQALAEDCFGVYCDRCPQRCAQKDTALWQEMLTRFAKGLTEDGGVCGQDVPTVFASRCVVMGRVLDEINATAAKRIGERRSGDRLRVAAEDYIHMGKLLAESAKLEAETSVVDTETTAHLSRLLCCHDFAAGSVTVYGSRYKRIFVHDIDLTGTRMGGEEIAALFGKAVGLPLSVPTFSLDGSLLSMELHTRHSARCLCGSFGLSAASLRQTRAGVNEPDADTADGHCGDTVSAFVGDGKQYMLLSDGMGTGRMAALTSGMAATFLEQTLTAGATLETALQMLNSVLRASLAECATTIDLCEIDLVTMEACFIKSGAAPSFVLRGGSLYRLQSKTVPIGILRALDAERIRFTLEPGDTIVMLSDGIARSFEECPWLLDLLTTDEDLPKGHVQAAAETIVREAANHGAIDDCTAGVIFVTQA